MTSVKETTQKFIKAIDKRFDVNLQGKAEKAQDSWYNSNNLNKIRRITSPAFYNLKEALNSKKETKGLKLHLGCGSKRF